MDPVLSIVLMRAGSNCAANQADYEKEESYFQSS